MTWSLETSCGNESAKIKYEIVPYTRGRGLDVGCGPSKAYAHFTGVDSCKDTQLFGIEIRPDIVVDDCIDLPFKDGSQDFVFSSHCLEHIEDHIAALREWWRVIKVGGHLVLYLPHKDLYPNIGQPGANPDHKHDFLPSDITEAMRSIGGWWLVRDEERAAGDEYSFFQVYRKRDDGEHLTLKQPARKTACVVRYGGFGDMLQAANVFPALKREGYHVTVMTTPRGRSVIEHDPHVDAWLIQDQDQVPNMELVHYWDAWKPQFDRWINLSESIEGTLLAMDGRPQWYWPDKIRRRYLGRNYLEWTSELAGVHFKPEARFYPTSEEADRSANWVAKRGFVVVVSLAGSSLHKAYPHTDAVVARIMTELPQATVVFVGDMACQILEIGWENEPRVVRTSGHLDIRETLALARAAHVVVGPETGVLNAVAFERGVRKVVMLSHSSYENLTKHWLSTDVIEPQGVGCYPCHKLHVGRGDCPVTEDLAAVCAASIDPARVFEPIKRRYQAWERKAE